MATTKKLWSFQNILLLITIALSIALFFSVKGCQKNKTLRKQAESVVDLERVANSKSRQSITTELNNVQGWYELQKNGVDSLTGLINNLKIKIKEGNKVNVVTQVVHVNLPADTIEKEVVHIVFTDRLIDSSGYITHNFSQGDSLYFIAGKVSAQGITIDSLSFVEKYVQIFDKTKVNFSNDKYSFTTLSTNPYIQTNPPSFTFTQKSIRRHNLEKVIIGLGSAAIGYGVGQIWALKK